MHYLLADTVTGVWEVEELEGEDCEVISQEDFYEQLGNLETGKLIGCEANPEYCSKIEMKFHRIQTNNLLRCSILPVTYDYLVN